MKLSIHFQAEDCSEAFERFKPCVPSNLQSRIQCLVLRGKSLIWLGYQNHGYTELEAALRLDPHNTELVKTIESLKRSKQ